MLIIAAGIAVLFIAVLPAPRFAAPRVAWRAD
jgi:hypothetical protein